jgi:glycosyltransferase involved in cell wall biosynthesis
VVWDVVDAWPQPEGNHWSREQALDWLHGQVAAIRPLAVVAATRRMAEDLQPAAATVLALPHHARPGLRPQALRGTVTRLGYEGSRKQLGRWREVLEAECTRRGWAFVMNPTSLADVDIVAALREAEGYPPRHWKSNVKLANAQACGVPIVCNRECGYLETASGGERWADDENELATALDSLTAADARRDAAVRLSSDAPTLEALARRYRAWLESLVPPGAARPPDWAHRLRRAWARTLKS